MTPAFLGLTGVALDKNDELDPRYPAPGRTWFAHARYEF